MAISIREKRLIAAAGLLLLILLVYLLLPGEPPPAVPPPAQPQVAAPQPPPPPPAPAPDVSGLKLYGLLASGAIVGPQGGAQRLVLVGREALPGLTLARIEQSHAVFVSAAGEVRLGFDGPSQAPVAAAAPAVAAPGEDVFPYRLGLAPRRAGGRVTGFAVRPGARLPALEQAGIRPGDVIVGVNGSLFDEERMLELPWQIANSTRTEFEVERGGRRLRLALPGH